MISMSKILKAAFFAYVIGSSTIAQAQTNETNSAAATAMKSSCRADYRAHCTGSDPAAPIAAACLAQFYVNLSKNCQTALDAYNRPGGEPEQQ